MALRAKGVKPEVRSRGRPVAGGAPRYERLLPAALTIFAQRGYEAANLRQIAALANVDVALIAHRFGSKLGLWQAVVEDLAHGFVRELASRAPAGDLDRMLDVLVDLNCNRPEVAIFLVREGVDNDARYEFLQQRMVKPVHDLLLPSIKAEIARLEKPPDPDFLFFALTGALAMTVTMRPVIARFTKSTANEDDFRDQLKSLLMVWLRAGRSMPLARQNALSGRKTLRKESRG